MNFERKVFDVLIIGSGAAGLACADRLSELGVPDICVLTDDVRGGTSRNAGSDKQTYYKPDFCSENGDSVVRMAADLFAGGAVSGKKALTEASESIRCFMRLVEAGVPFPKDAYGRFPGYRTDHDNTGRATSAGPLTSKYMAEALERKVRSHGVPVLGGLTAVKLIKDNDRCVGVVCVDSAGVFRSFCAKAVVLATGAPAAIYKDSVFPVEQIGATGIAVEAGAKLCNFQEWQYGIASLKFRWNLSGSYQQVIPRYFSRSEDGTEREFLLEAGSPDDICSLIFLKGYQWPFDCRKTDASSKIDLLIAEEKRQGNRVFMDFTREPDGLEPGKLCGEARDFWATHGLTRCSPFERLMKLNPKAIKVYKDHGIDLAAEPLEIGVCAQHNNGGIYTDTDGRTSIPGLYAVGEAAGNFGIYRPGGSALNDTQVSALRTAEALSRVIGDLLPPEEISCEPERPVISDTPTLPHLKSLYSKRMSDFAGIRRSVGNLETLAEELRILLNDFCSVVTIGDFSGTADFFNFRSAVISALALCVTEKESALKAGSRGGCVCIGENGETLPENELYRNYLTVTDGDGVSFVPVDPIPTEIQLFEELLKNQDV